MKQATLKASQFLARTGIHSTKGSRRGFVDVETGVNPADLMTIEQQRDNLQRRINKAGERRAQIKADPRCSKAGRHEYEVLGQQMFTDMTALAALPKRSVPSYQHSFVEAAIALLPEEWLRKLDREASVAACCQPNICHFLRKREKATP